MFIGDLKVMRLEFIISVESYSMCYVFISFLLLGSFCIREKYRNLQSIKDSIQMFYGDENV